VRLLWTGETLGYDHDERTLSITAPAERPTPDEVVAVSWDGRRVPGVDG
jgi:hypothetical protein